MKNLEISLFGRPNCGKTTLMKAFQAILKESGSSGVITYERNANGDISSHMETVMAEVPVRFSWNPGGVIYYEEEMRTLLNRGKIAVCLVDPLYGEFKDWYYDKLFELVVEIHNNAAIPWIYALNKIDQLKVPVCELDLPVIDAELYKTSAWHGTGVKEFFDRVETEVRTLRDQP